MINYLGNYYNSIDTWEIQRAQVTFAKDLVLGSSPQQSPPH